MKSQSKPKGLVCWIRISFLLFVSVGIVGPILADTVTEPLLNINTVYQVKTVDISPDGKVFATSANSGPDIWSVTDGSHIKQFSGQTGLDK